MEPCKEKPVYDFFKRVFDVILSGLAIVVLSPLMLGLAIAVRSDGGPAIYSQKRVGKNGKHFRIYKFRSMCVNADSPEMLAKLAAMNEMDGPAFKIKNDPRITKVGRFIRRTSLDELPQLFNILAGTLSLVGPRPVLQEETELYGDKRSLLLSCKPGLTGLWQVRGRSNVTYEDGRRQALELNYISHRGLWLDIKILFWTVGAVVRMDGAK